MTTDELIATFDRISDEENEYLKFDRIAMPMHRRPDICAFLMLDAVCGQPNSLGTYNDMVSATEHDKIWLSVDLDDLA